MTKDQLKSGMILERRDGKRFILFKDIFPGRNDIDRAVCMNESKTFIRMYDYNNNLFFISKKREYDIVKVFIPKYLERVFSGLPIDVDLVWERPQEKYTYEQLKAIIGHDFDFVG